MFEALSIILAFFIIMFYIGFCIYFCWCLPNYLVESDDNMLFKLFWIVMLLVGFVLTVGNFIDVVDNGSTNYSNFIKTIIIGTMGILCFKKDDIIYEIDKKKKNKEWKENEKKYRLRQEKQRKEREKERRIREYVEGIKEYDF